MRVHMACESLCLCCSLHVLLVMQNPSLRTSQSKVIPCLNSLAADSDVDVQYFASEALQEVKQHA